ncbi:hypothetical protein BDY24DRAFT_386244 [Mrakia frigida]|uniref:GPALPP motifs-containing protein 1 n=1 Tax=Mrakia frigida TaxID=29902 RepID=UPI003FCC12AA
MAIGPTLPPHLQKLADQQQQESEDGSDDDSYGPAPPRPSAPPSSSSVSIGPTLPPHLQFKPQPESDDEEEDDSLGPALPPHLLAARQTKSSVPVVAGPSRPTAGPSRPPAGYQAPSPPRRGRYDDDDSDDDVVGPMPVPEGMESAYSGSAVRDFEEREARWAKEREEAAKPKVLKREEWMLKPPEAGDILSNLDPTKIPRGQTAFNRVSAAPIKKEDQSLWTETPAERQERLRDEVSGKRKRAEISAKNQPMDEAEADEMRRRKRRDKELKEEIDLHNKANRSSTLLDMHSKAADDAKKSGKGADDGPPPIWDRDLHMNVTGKLMDDKSRTASIMDAKGLGSRFGHGKGGAFS